MDILSTVIAVLIGIFMGAILVRSVGQQPQQIIIQETPAAAPELVPTPLPYWTAYGLPQYWPTYLSPYWYYGVPWSGPITGGSYYPGGHYGPDRRGAYAPHGSQPGYTGVSVGGAGGGHGGGGGGHGGGGR